MNIYIREMKANAKSLVIWCVCMILLIVIGMQKYAGFSSTGAEIMELFNSMPEGFKAVFGTDRVNLLEMRGFYSIFYLYFSLMCTIQAGMLGGNIVSKEERDKTTEFLLVKPVKRSRIVTAKISAAITNCLILSGVTMINSFIFVKVYGNGETINQEILILTGGLVIMQLIFFSIGLMVSALSKNPKIGSAVATGSIMATFILSVVIDISDKIDALKYITPFKYFDGKTLVADLSYKPIYLIISAGIVLVCGYLTFVFYKKRDLNI